MLLAAPVAARHEEARRSADRRVDLERRAPAYPAVFGHRCATWSDDPDADAAAGAAAVLATDSSSAEVRAALIDAFAARPGADSFCVSQLTTRQLEVLVLVGGGLANKQIAHVLGVSISTVKRHMEQLMERTGRRNRAGLAALAADLGELRPETLSVLNRADAS